MSVTAARPDTPTAAVGALLRLPEQRPAPLDPDRPQSVAKAWQSTLARRLVALDLAIAGPPVQSLSRSGSDSRPPCCTRCWRSSSPVGFVAMIAVARGYEGRFLGSGSEEYRRVANAGVRYVALVMVVSYAMRLELARGFVLLAFPLAVVLVLLGRYAARQALHRARRNGRLQPQGPRPRRERRQAELIRQLRSESHAGLDVVGACLDGSEASTVEGRAVLVGRRTACCVPSRTAARHGCGQRLVPVDAGRPSPAVRGS
jgi:hypothetical protein